MDLLRKFHKKSLKEKYAFPSNQDGHSVVPLEEAYDGTIQNFSDEDGMGPILPPTGSSFYYKKCRLGLG